MGPYHAKTLSSMPFSPFTCPYPQPPVPHLSTMMPRKETLPLGHHCPIHPHYPCHHCHYPPLTPYQLPPRTLSSCSNSPPLHHPLYSPPQTRPSPLLNYHGRKMPPMPCHYPPLISNRISPVTSTIPNSTPCCHT